MLRIGSFLFTLPPTLNSNIPAGALHADSHLRIYTKFYRIKTDTVIKLYVVSNTKEEKYEQDF